MHKSRSAADRALCAKGGELPAPNAAVAVESAPLWHAQSVNLSQITGPLLAAIGVAMSALARAISFGAIMSVIAVYLAAQPRLYRRLVLGLVPPAQRQLPRACSIARRTPCGTGCLDSAWLC